MNLREMLVIVQKIWLNQWKLKELAETENEKIKKIEQDPRRSQEQKLRAIKSLQNHKNTLEKDARDFENQLLIEYKNRNDHYELIKQIINQPKKYETENQNISTYDDILPLMQFAYHEEKNGNPEKHAETLATIFDKKEDVIQYLNRFAENHPKNRDVVHDASLLTIPALSPFQKHWLHLAKQKHGENLLNPTFVKLFHLAKDIEMQITSLQRDTLVLEQESEIEISQQIKVLRNFCDKYTAGQLPRDEKNREKNKDNLKVLQALHAKRAVLHAKKPFNEYHIKDIEDVYHYLLSKNFAKSFFIELGIDDARYQRFIKLDRSQASKNIPDVLLDCGENFYIKKLNVQDEKEATIAACLGKLTNCCQSISGEMGEECAIHGLTDENSGFYVLFRGNYSEPDIDKDEVYAQTWVNRTASGMLVFDSIETAKGSVKATKQIIAAYRQLANYLVHQLNIPKVQCGASSGISWQVGIKGGYGLVNEPPLNYKGYRDSHKQLFLADKDVLVLLDSNGLTLDEKGWQEEAKTEMISEKSRKTIRWIISNEFGNFFEKICLISKPIEIYFKRQQQYVQELKNYSEDHRRKPDLSGEIDTALLTTLKYSHEESGLILASKYGDEKVAHFQLKNNANVDYKTPYQETALIYALRNKYQNENLSLLLLQHKANPNVRTQFAETPLKLAVKNGYIKAVYYLMECKADVNDGSLVIASEKGYTDIVKKLLQNKASVTYTEDYNHKTALMFAAGEGHVNIVKILLLHKADVNLANGNQSTPFHYAIFSRKDVIINLLLEHHSDINKINYLGKTALWHAVENEDEALVYQLLSKKADPNIYSGDTPLDRAAFTGNRNIIRMLLEKCTTKTLNEQFGEQKGFTALMTAAMFNNEEMVDMLLEQKGIDPFCVTYNGYNVLHLAACKDNPSTIDKLLKLGFDVNKQDNFGDSALMHAADSGCEKVVARLLQEKNINLHLHKEHDGRQFSNAIMIATREGHGNIVKMLATAKADLNWQDCDGDTVLMIALKHKQDAIVDLLLQFKPDLTLKNNDGEDAMNLARTKQSPHVEKIELALNPSKYLSAFSVFQSEKAVGDVPAPVETEINLMTVH